MPTHIIGNNGQDGRTPIRDQFIAYPGLYPSKVHPGMGRRKKVVEVVGIDGPEIAALSTFNISNTNILSLCNIDRSAVASRYGQTHCTISLLVSHCFLPFHF
jgi:hypothetical protein